MFVLSGCAMDGHNPHKISYSPASAYILNDKICVYISEHDLQKKENVLSISVNEYGAEKNYLFNKNYSLSDGNFALMPGVCIKDLYSFTYELGKGYVVRIRTPLNLYISSFVVWNRVDGVVLIPVNGGIEVRK